MRDDGGVRRGGDAVLRVFAVASLSACTWLSDPFDAAPTPADAGVATAPAEDAAVAAVVAADASSGPGPGCDGGATEGSLEDGLAGACAVELAAPGLAMPPPASTPLVPDAGSAGDASAAEAGAPAAAACATFEGFGAPELVSTGLVSAGAPFGPALSADGLQLYFSVLLPGSEQLYTASRATRSQASFSNASEVVSTNTPALEGSPFVSADDRRIYFFSDRFGGVGGRDIWVSERAGAGFPFAPALLVGGVNTPSFEHLPSLSADELSILFVSSRPAGLDSDLWSATRSGKEVSFDAPVNVAALNSTDTEGRAVLSSDGLSVIFSSDRPGGLGAADLWTSTRPDLSSPFSVPLNLAQANSAADDLDVAVSSDEQELFFASGRAGQSALWRSTRVCP
jgi:hypothetical protein